MLVQETQTEISEYLTRTAIYGRRSRISLSQPRIPETRTMTWICVTKVPLCVTKMTYSDVTTIVRSEEKEQPTIHTQTKLHF